MITSKFRRDSYQIIIYYMIEYYRKKWKNRS